jgi:hypothetical protein
MISTEAVASRQGPADRSGLRSWLNRASLLPVATTEMHAVRPRCRASRGGDPGRGRAARVSGSRAPTADTCPEGNWGLGALADDVALIVAEFSSSAWTHGDLPITVRLWLRCRHRPGDGSPQQSLQGDGVGTAALPMGICRHRARSHIVNGSASSRQSAPQR